MKRPTEFIPIYDQTQEQAADMVEKLFVEIERLEGLASHTCAGCEEKDAVNSAVEIYIRDICAFLNDRGIETDETILRNIKITSRKIREVVFGPAKPTCPGCAAKDKRLGEAREAWPAAKEIVMWHWINNVEGDPSSPAPKFVTALDTALNGGDGFLRGNPHHLSTDTALNGKEGADGMAGQ